MSLIDGTASASGASLPGIPGIMMGRTDSFSWAYSSSMADVQDLYIQVFVPKQEHRACFSKNNSINNNNIYIYIYSENNAGQYLYQGQYQDYFTSTEVIQVKGSTSVTITVNSTVYGPVLNGIVSVPGNQTIALKWTGLQFNNDSSLV